MGAMASQITSPTIVCSTVYSGADQRKHQSSASLAFERGIHRGPVNSPHKLPVTRKMFPFDDVIMNPVDLKSNRFEILLAPRQQRCQVPVKYQSDMAIAAFNLAASRLHEIWRKDVVPISE